MPVSRLQKIFFNILGLDWRVNVSGEAFEKHPDVNGVYIFQKEFNNGKPFWLQDKGEFAIWYQGSDNYPNYPNYLNWILGPLNNKEGAILCSEVSSRKFHDQTWRYEDQGSFEDSSENIKFGIEHY